MRQAPTVKGLVVQKHIRVVVLVIESVCTPQSRILSLGLSAERDFLTAHGRTFHAADALEDVPHVRVAREDEERRIRTGRRVELRVRIARMSVD